MDALDVSRLFCKYDSLVRNRVEVLNDITEDRVRYVYGHGGCSVSMLGRELCAYAWHDVDGARFAADSLHLLINALWDCRREGLTCFS